MAANLRGNWTDQECWYASIQDAGKTALVLGPFPTEASCREWAYGDAASGGTDKHSALVKAGCDRDCKAWFYAWGMVKMPNGYKDGVLNRFLPEAELDAVRAVGGVVREVAHV